MDIYALLMQDHEEVMDLFMQLEETKGGRRGKGFDALFDQLKNELELHMIGEEEFFYPALQEHKEMYAQILESREEHHVVSLILDELSAIPKDDRWFAKLAVLRENVENHIAKEEQDIFPAAEEIIDPGQAELAGLNMSEMKEAQTAAAR
ncbi:MAG TPA: hemerythrin domain-containing protein [Dissulfurispiraceae bacterium]